MKYYTFDELRALGCPDELLIQYALMTKDWIDRMLNASEHVADK